ncbi:MAG TPA: MlaD family protein [Polyangiaceae bacterium LLY-WYZ-14_1]|nr:MlaD family protein [Polyangiaceae bacterium LLY-WYZ-14_1]
MQRERRIELRVGLFVLGALAIGTAFAFVIGKRSNLWQSKAGYHAYFEDVGGLRAGSPILIGGVNVGTVSEVELRDDGTIRVDLNVVRGATDLVRTDSVASIGNKGLLGDRLVAISVGRGDPLEPGGEVATAQTRELAEYMSEAGGILDDVGGVAENVRRATDPIGNEEFGQALGKTASNIQTITEAIAHGDGPIARLLDDEELAARISRTVANLEVTTRELAAASRSARLIVDEVRTGDGSAHELLYGEQGTRLVTNLADVSGELAVTLQAIRTGDGAAHELVYGEDGSQMVENLVASTAHLERILFEVREGRGTLGAFITDPSVYEDVKRLVGDMERNAILRSLVRYSIRRDETVDTALVEETMD